MVSQVVTKKKKTTNEFNKKYQISTVTLYVNMYFVVLGVYKIELTKVLCHKQLYITGVLLDMLFLPSNTQIC